MYHVIGWQKEKCSFSLLHMILLLTLVSTVGVSLITVIPTVIVTITGPIFWDAAAAVTFKLHAGA